MDRRLHRSPSLWPIAIAVLLLAAAAAPAAPPPGGDASGEALLCLSIRAWVDGVSDLVIQPQTVYWQNREHAKPGTPADHLVAEVPTLLNRKPWLPRWRGEQSDALHTSHFPPTFAGLAPVLAPTEARGDAALVDAGNQQMVVRFTDRPLDADCYHVWLVAVPEAYKPLADALAEGLARAAACDAGAVAKTADRLRTYVEETEVPAGLRDRAVAQVLTCAMDACRAVDFARATDLLALADAVQPKDRGVTELRRWIAKASEPVFEDDFERSTLGR